MDGLTAPQFGEILEQGKQATTNSVKSAVSDITSSVSGQLGISNEKGASGQTNNQVQSQNQNSQSEPITNGNNLNSEQTIEMVKDFYAPSTSSASINNPKTQEEQETAQKLIKLRQELHQQTYYDPLVAYEHKQNERPAEVIEKEEEQKKMMELKQKKKQDNIPLAVLRAQTSAEVKLAGAG